MKKRISMIALALALAVTAAACSGGSAKSGRLAAPEDTVATRVSYDGAMNAADKAGGYEGIPEAEMEIAENPQQSGGEQAASSQAKIIRTQDYTLETVDFDDALAALKGRPAQFGGYIESSEVGSGSRGLRWVRMTVRVPQDRLDAFSEGLSELGTVRHFSESTENVTLRYVDLESHIRALRTEQESLMEMLEKADSLDEMIYIQSHLTDVRYQIESYESQLRVLSDKVDYSTVSLYLSEVERETNTDKSFFGEAGALLGDTLYTIGQDIRSFGVFLIGRAPFLILAALIVWGVIAFLRRLGKKAGKTPPEDGGPEKTE